MVNYAELPLFPLHVVLYPEMPLPLRVFEPRYREMVRTCRETNTPFGVALIRQGEEVGQEAVPHVVGTTARIVQCENDPDGHIQIVVTGETRFRIERIHGRHAYLTGTVAPFWETEGDPSQVAIACDVATSLFKRYLRALLALTNRPLSAVQLPGEAESLSFAIASVLQISLIEKQHLLEIDNTQERLDLEIDLLKRELALHLSTNHNPRGERPHAGRVVTQVSAKQLSRLSSLN